MGAGELREVKCLVPWAGSSLAAHHGHGHGHSHGHVGKPHLVEGPGLFPWVAPWPQGGPLVPGHPLPGGLGREKDLTWKSCQPRWIRG